MITDAAKTTSYLGVEGMGIYVAYAGVVAGVALDVLKFRHIPTTTTPVTETDQTYDRLTGRITLKRKLNTGANLKTSEFCTRVDDLTYQVKPLALKPSAPVCADTIPCTGSGLTYQVPPLNTGDLTWTNAPVGCSLNKIDSQHYTLTQPTVTDVNLIGHNSLSFSGDLTLGRSAWQDALEPIVTDATYFASFLVTCEGDPAYGADGLFRVVLSGTSPNYGTPTWTRIDGYTNLHRLDLAGLTVKDSTGRIGIWRTQGQADTREFNIAGWNITKDYPGRPLPQGAVQSDFTRVGNVLSLTTALENGCTVEESL